MNEKLPLVSIVIPCLNGAERLQSALQSLSGQNYPSHLLEVIIADGGSTDGTREVAIAAGARVVDNPGRRVAPGRNVGFAASRGSIVAFTDDDCTFPPDWVTNAVRRLAERDAGGIGGPTWIPRYETGFGLAVAELFVLATALTGSVHRERVSVSTAVDDLPGCNCFFRRAALALVMPTGEALVTGDDVELCLRVRETGYRLELAPDVGLWHHKRPTPRGLFRQMYRYAIGRLQVGRLHRPLLRPVHVLAGLFLPLALAGILGLLLWSPTGLLLLLISLTAVLLFVGAVASVRRSRAGVALWLPIVFVMVPTAWSLGFLHEVLFPHGQGRSNRTPSATKTNR